MCVCVCVDTHRPSLEASAALGGHFDWTLNFKGVGGSVSVVEVQLGVSGMRRGAECPHKDRETSVCVCVFRAQISMETSTVRGGRSVVMPTLSGDIIHTLTHTCSFSINHQ